ncbi:hypothetical protein [Gimesia aquarii]|uniref:Uncharacterized protein n=1 Tax=Gimesia aquarii TaxID=2527964 RepID=A0A517WQ16_9PLAN|nr:hypothetical protein [Gimesia aquarii]QDU07351.1 hypothetical protein V202x_07030 [Gimesia aquarii]
MSTDYSIFLESDLTSPEYLFAPLLGINGGDAQFGLHIHGLVDVSCQQLDASYREVMREDYGEFGLDVNWMIGGTYDKETDIFKVMRILYEYAAVLVNANPERSLSLMRNGESFYVFNTRNRLILSPIYLESIPVIKSLFKKPFIIDEMIY